MGGPVSGWSGEEPDLDFGTDPNPSTGTPDLAAQSCATDFCIGLRIPAPG